MKKFNEPFELLFAYTEQYSRSLPVLETKTFKSVEEEREQLMRRLDELEREESSNLREKLDAAIKVIKSICFLASDALLCLS